MCLGKDHECGLGSTTLISIIKKDPVSFCCHRNKLDLRTNIETEEKIYTELVLILSTKWMKICVKFALSCIEPTSCEFDRRAH